MAKYVQDSANTQPSPYNGELTYVGDGTELAGAEYAPTAEDYPQNGTIDLTENGDGKGTKQIDTQYTMLENEAFHAVFNADGSTEYEIESFEVKAGGKADRYYGNQDTPIALADSDVDYVPGSPVIVTSDLPIGAPDVTKPVITMLGTTPVEVENGTPYVDAGATALDDVDGDITANIVTVNNVDVDTDASYNVTYNVDDSAGNPADEVVRVVNVVTPVVLRDPVWISFGSDGASALPETLNTFEDFTNTSVRSLVDINGVASDITIQALQAWNEIKNGYDDTIYCMSGKELWRSWNFTSGSQGERDMEIYLPEGTYEIEVGALSSTTETSDNFIVHYTLDGLTQTIDSQPSTNTDGYCRTWTVTSVGEIFNMNFKINAGGYNGRVNAIHITEV